MHALTDFLTTDYGLMSAAVIALVIGMGAWIGQFVRQRVREDTAAHDRQVRAQK